MIPSFSYLTQPLKLLFLRFSPLLSMQIPVSSLRDTVLELAVFDEHRRKFDNFSSLMLEWKSSNKTLAHFENDSPVEMVAKDDGSGQTRSHGIARTHEPFRTAAVVPHRALPMGAVPFRFYRPSPSVFDL